MTTRFYVGLVVGVVGGLILWAVLILLAYGVWEIIT